MSSQTRVLYAGFTNDIERRVSEHKQGHVLGFSSKYRTQYLVYFEETSDVHAALAREKQIKGWTRAKKVALIESANPGWDDLSSDWNRPEVLGDPSLRSG
jgi:putative endonuclease